MQHRFLPLFFLCTLITVAATTQMANAVDSPITITNAPEGYTLENIKLTGDGTGIAITITNSSRIILRNVTLTDWACGINTTNGIFNSYYDLNIQNCGIGWHINGFYGINRAYGGSIVNNNLGVLLSNGTCMNQFYGTEIEWNINAEVQFGDDVYGNLFEGCYFERTEATSDYFFLWQASSIGSNTFIANKFASQGDSVLTLKGNGTVFNANLFHGATQELIWDVYGNGSSITNNRAVYPLPGLAFNDYGTSNTRTGNYFYNVNINQASTTTSTVGASPFGELAYGIVSVMIFLIVVGFVKKVRKR